MIKNNYSLKQLNTFGIDVKAKTYTVCTTIEELRTILTDPAVKKERKLVLGGGSNILFTQDFDGVVLHNRLKFIEVARETNEHIFIKAGAGVVWHDFVLYTIERNLGGVENLSLIPGSVGASPIQNIGAYGVEVKDVFDSLEAIDVSTGSLRTFTQEECAFGYRNSIFKNELKGQYIISSVTFRLSKKPVFNTSYGAIQATLEEMQVRELSVKAVSDAVIHIRKSKLPDPTVIGNAGSFFKNPEIPEAVFTHLQKNFPDIPCYKSSLPGMVKVPAGWLNEQCGWKGKTIGATGVHKNQALVLVNYGSATGAEIWQLAKDIQKSVLQKFGIALETEVNII